MSLTERVAADITRAMRERNQLTLDALRLLKTALTNKRVELTHDLDERAEAQVVSSLVKQRKDAIEQYSHAGRTDLADKEQAELAVLEGYLPAAATDEEIARTVDDAISELGATSAKDVGNVMKTVMARFAGKFVDGKAVNAVVRQRLGA
jgi:uncharacterized protein YqeY